MTAGRRGALRRTAGPIELTDARVTTAAAEARDVTNAARGCRPVADRANPSGRRSPPKQKGRCSRTGPHLLFLGGGGPIVALAPTDPARVAVDGVFVLQS
jgi:hypothetical protein